MGITPAGVWYGYVTFNGLPSYNYGILVEHPPGYHIAERDYEYIHVPGRNGDLIIDKGSYKNGRRDYDIAFGSEVEDYEDMAVKVSEWLHSPSGYARLEDTYEPDFFRRASYVDEVDFENILAHAGRATISFNCMPQRFYTSGETTQVVPVEQRTDSGYLIWMDKNPSRHAALPYIKVTGNGTIRLSVNGLLWMTIQNVVDYVEIDCDIQNVYKGSTNMNANVQFSDNANGAFPSLINSSSYSNKARLSVNNANASSEVTKLEVKPRWWTL